MRYLLDEDVNPTVAEIALGLGLDAVSVHELGRSGPSYPDDAQLRFAASQRSTVLTRNRNDYLKLTVAFFQAGEPHFGVLIIPFTLPNKDPARIAHALHQWHRQHVHSESYAEYFIDFLPSSW